MSRGSAWAVFLTMAFVYWIGVTLAAVCAGMPAWQDLMLKQFSLPEAYRLTSLVLTSPLLLTAALLGVPIVLALPLVLLKNETARAWAACVAATVFGLVPVGMLFSMLIFLAHAVDLLAPAQPVVR